MRFRHLTVGLLGLAQAIAATPAGADTTIAGPVTFGGTFAVNGAGTVDIAGGAITNTMLQNPALTIGGTGVALGATATTVSGLTLSGATLSGGTTLPGGGGVTSAGLVGIGTAGPGAPLVVDSGINPLAAGFGSVVIQGNANKERVDIYSAGSNPGPAFQGKGFGGTVASPTATVSGTSIFILAGSGYDGTGFVVPNPAAIFMLATENWSSSAHGSAIAVDTTQNGATSRQERMRVANTGYVGIGTAAPNYLLHLNDPGSAGALLQFTNATTGSGPGNGGYIGYLAGGTDLWLNNQYNGAVKLLANGVEQLRVDGGGGFYLANLPTTPGGKQPLCFDAAAKQVYAGSGGAC